MLDRGSALAVAWKRRRSRTPIVVAEYTFYPRRDLGHHGGRVLLGTAVDPSDGRLRAVLRSRPRRFGGAGATPVLGSGPVQAPRVLAIQQQDGPGDGWEFELLRFQSGAQLASLIPALGLPRVAHRVGSCLRALHERTRVDELALCHGDLHPGNIVVPYRLDRSVLIDWDCSNVGRPVTDVAASAIAFAVGLALAPLAGDPSARLFARYSTSLLRGYRRSPLVDDDEYLAVVRSQIGQAAQQARQNAVRGGTGRSHAVEERVAHRLDALAEAFRGG